jgi:hypothetical protein
MDEHPAHQSVSYNKAPTNKSWTLRLNLELHYLKINQSSLKDAIN